MAGETSFVDEFAPEPEEEEAPAVEPQADEPEEPQGEEAPQADEGPSGRERDDRGRFIARDGAEEEAEGSPPPKGYVPHEALHQSREEGKAVKQSLRDAELKIARLETLFEQVSKRAQQPQQQKPEVPAFDQDPANHLRGRMEELAGAVTRLDGQSRQQAEAEQGQARQTQFLNQYATAARSFSQHTPDFKEAYEWLATDIDGELQVRGFTDAAQRTQTLLYEEGRLVGDAMGRGEDPAQVIYNLAKRRGYTGAAPEAAEEPQGAPRLAQLQKGQAASRSLSGPKGRGEDNLSVQRLVELADEDPDEFDRRFDEAKRKGMLG